MADSGRSADGAQTLERGLDVLLALADHPDGLTVSAVAEATRLHRSIVNRLLVSLQRTSFAQRDSLGLYRIGPTLTSLVDRVRPGLREVAEPVLHRLALELDATASLVEVVSDAAVATVVAEPPTDGPRFSYRLGNRDPLDRGAGGLAALASGEPGPNDTVRVQEIRDAGFVATYSEVTPGAYGVAAPIPRLPNARASVNVVTNRQQIIDRAIPLVIAAANEISDSVR